jgi:hypothetical protein
LSKPEFSIWTNVSRIVRFSCPRHKEFAIGAGHIHGLRDFGCQARINAASEFGESS